MPTPDVASLVPIWESNLALAGARSRRLCHILSGIARALHWSTPHLRIDPAYSGRWCRSRPAGGPSWRGRERCLESAKTHPHRAISMESWVICRRISAPKTCRRTSRVPAANSSLNCTSAKGTSAGVIDPATDDIAARLADSEFDIKVKRPRLYGFAHSTPGCRRVARKSRPIAQRLAGRWPLPRPAYGWCRCSAQSPGRRG